MDKSKRNVIAYFADRNSDEYRNFQVAFFASCTLFSWQCSGSFYESYYVILEGCYYFTRGLRIFGWYLRGLEN